MFVFNGVKCKVTAISKLVSNKSSIYTDHDCFFKDHIFFNVGSDISKHSHEGHVNQQG